MNKKLIVIGVAVLIAMFALLKGCDSSTGFARVVTTVSSSFDDSDTLRVNSPSMRIRQDAVVIAFATGHGSSDAFSITPGDYSLVAFYSTEHTARQDGLEVNTV